MDRPGQAVVRLDTRASGRKLSEERARRDMSKLSLVSGSHPGDKTTMNSSRLNHPADLQVVAIPRPSGGVLLAGQILPRDVFSELPGDVRIWMRWAPPEETGLESAALEFAVATPRDEAVRTARVIARAALSNRRIAWNVYQLLEIQGLTDLLVVGPTAPDGSCSEVVHELVCADLTLRSQQYGLPLNHFPQRYV